MESVTILVAVSVLLQVVIGAILVRRISVLYEKISGSKWSD